jgi:general secretion pathway protein D
LNLVRFCAALLICVVLAGCAGDVAFKKGEKAALNGDLDRAVSFYRQALQQDPENVAYLTRLTKVQDQAALNHIDRAVRYLQAKNPEAAMYEAGQANLYAPNSDKARLLMEKAQKLKDTMEAIASGKSYLAAGRPTEALRQFKKALELDPKNKAAAAYVERITKQKAQAEEIDELNLASNEPITLSFKDAKLKEVFEFLSKISGISILFDEDVKDQPVTVFAKDVSFKQALNLLLATNKMFMKKIAKDAIIIIPKTKSKLDQYQDLMIRTFYLSHIQAKDMVNILRTMLETRKIIINDSLNSITLRETPDKLKLAEKLIAANDRQDSEVIIDVSVMSVDKGPDETDYGIAWPTSVTGTILPGGLSSLTAGSTTTDANGNTIATPSSIPTSVTTNWLGGTDSSGNHIPGLKDALHSFGKNLVFSYPSATATLSEKWAKAETLTNPQIRTLNNKPAKILIGSRIPVQTSTAVGSAVVGAVSTFEYRDIGIKLTVEPDIGLGDDVKLKTTLEVSSLGASISVGGLSEPTFNTTTAETTLSLKDGETVIIGGLMQNVDGSSATGLAGVMDVPILGKLFSSNVVGPNSKRELVMTLTPHIVRPMEVPGPQDTSFWSGTEEAYDTKPLFEESSKNLSMPETEAAPEGAAAQAPVPAAPAGPVAGQPVPGTPAQHGTAQPGASAGALAQQGAPAQPGTPPARTGANAAATPTPGKIGRVGTLSFTPEVIPVNVGQEITVDVMATDLDSVYEAPLSIIYNPKLVKFVKAEEGDYMNVDKKPTSFIATANEKIGVINVMLTRVGSVPGVAGSGRLFSLTFKGLAPGISPLVFKQNDLKDVNHVAVPADLKTGTLYVK